MWKKILYLLLLVFGSNYLFAQYCNTSGYCSNKSSAVSSSASSYSGSGANWVNLASAIFGGQYVKCNVTKGNTYEFSTCNTFGGTNGASGTTFDPELTLYDASWNPICFHDNWSSSSTCPKAPYLSWKNDPSTGFNGYVYILVNNAWYGQCKTYTTSAVRLMWREISGCTTPNIPSISSATSITQSSFYANWSYATGATSYYVEVSSNSTFTDIIASGNVGNTNNVLVDGLDCNTYYWYRVKSINNCTESNFSSSATLKTTNTKLSDPGLLSPTNITPSSFDLNWSYVSGATSYYVEIGTSSSFSTILANGNVGNSNTINIYGGNCNTTYWYRVKAINNCNPSGFSTSSVSTKNITSLSSPNLQSPTNITSSSFTVNWDKVTDASYYYLGVSTNSSFTDTVAQGNFTNNSITVLQLAGNYNYCYRVKAITSCKESGYSSACTKTSNCTSGPGTPSIQNPTDITASSFVANWTGASNVYYYLFEIANSTAFSPVLASWYLSGTASSIKITGFANNTTYCYRVKAYNSCSTGSNYSSPACGTTTSTCSPPNPPNVLDPINPVTSGFTAKWSSSSGATSYYLTVYSNSSLTKVLSNYNELYVNNVLSYPVKGLNCNTTYYYTVKAAVACGKSSPSSSKAGKTSSCTSNPPAGNAIGSSNNIPKSDPIQIGTGTYKYVHTDFRIPVFNGDLIFTRYYNSLNGNKNGSLGYGWSHTYSYAVENLSDTAWDVHYPDGHFARFIPDTTGFLSYPIYPGTYDSLVKKGSGEYLLYNKFKTTFKFQANGRLSEIIDLNGNQTILTYKSDSLIKVQAPDGKTLIFDYDNSNHITSVKVNSGRKCLFGYDGNGNFKYSLSPKGDTIKFTYNSDHSILKVFNALGHIVVDNTYDGQNRVIGQKDAYGNSTLINYNSPNNGDAVLTFPNNSKEIIHHDSFFRITKTIDQSKNISRVFYDKNGNYDSITNVLSQTTQFDYDIKGNLTQQTLPSNRKAQFSYNNYCFPLQKSDPLGKKTLFGYDFKGNLTSILFPDLSTRIFKYDIAGKLILSINGVNDSTLFFYNTTTSYLDSIRNPIGGTIKYFYDTDGRLTKIIDANKNPTFIKLDANDNIVKIIDSYNDSIQFVYDADNQLTKAIDKNGFVLEYSYDKKGRLLTKKNQLNQVDSFFYDAMDNLTGWKDALGQKTTHVYDSLNRRIAISNFAGITKFEYDNLGQLTKLVDPINHSLEFNYNDANLIGASVDALSRVTITEYDKADNLKTLTNHRGNKVHYDYNSLNKLVKVLDVDNETTYYQYDSMGRLKYLTDGNNHVQQYKYGKGGLLTDYKDGAGNSYTYQYDLNGNENKIIKPVGNISKEYDKINRLIKVINSTGDTYNYTYDANNNLTKAKNNTGTSGFYYDELNRMNRYVDLFGKEVKFGFNPVGRIDYIVYPGNDTVKYKYDKANRLWKVKDWKNNEFIYTYDSTGKIKKLLYPTGIHCDYSYDAANRLISKLTYTASNKVLYGQTFTFPNDTTMEEMRDGSFPAGIVSDTMSYEYRKDDALQKVSKRIYTNDNNGNRTKEVYKNDTIKYAYTTDQLLTTLNKKGIATTFKYDALGHRIERIKGADKTRYVLNFNSPISLVLQTTDENGNIRKNYIYGLGLLESIDSLGNELFYHYDGNHNTVAITDKNDSVKATYTYLPKGALIWKTGILTQPFTFLGDFGVEQETDSCYYIRARYLDASTGRFLSKDPLFGDEFEPQTLNRYLYALNNPLNSYDVTGLTTADDDSPKFLDLFSLKATADNISNALDHGRKGEAYLASVVAVTQYAFLGVSAFIIGRAALSAPTITVPIISSAVWAQKTFSNVFSQAGSFAGQTIDDVALALRSGTISVTRVPIDVIVRNGQTFILNTRSSVALLRANIPLSSWNIVNRTGQVLYENRLTEQLTRNGLINGTRFIQETGTNIITSFK